MEKENKINEERKFYTIARKMKAGFQPRSSVCRERANYLIGNDQLRMEI